VVVNKDYRNVSKEDALSWNKDHKLTVIFFFDLWECKRGVIIYSSVHFAVFSISEWEHI